MLMNIWSPKGEMRQVQHFDHDAWIKEGWLTNPPEKMVEVEPEKKKVTKL